LKHDRVPEEFEPFLRHIQNLKYDMKPDYDFLFALLESATNRKDVRESDAYDWERTASTPSVTLSTSPRERETAAAVAGTVLEDEQRTGENNNARLKNNDNLIDKERKKERQRHRSRKNRDREKAREDTNRLLHTTDRLAALDMNDNAKHARDASCDGDNNQNERERVRRSRKTSAERKNNLRSRSKELDSKRNLRLRDKSYDPKPPISGKPQSRASDPR